VSDKDKGLESGPGVLFCTGCTHAEYTNLACHPSLNTATLAVRKKQGLARQKYKENTHIAALQIVYTTHISKK
jgi:hypothetical protein